MPGDPPDGVSGVSVHNVETLLTHESYWDALPRLPAKVGR
jgi:hypothetical protein